MNTCSGETGGTPHHQIELEEMLMLWLANQNPAFEPYRELFDDTPLRQETAYPLVMTGMREFFATQPTFGLDNQNLIDFLRLPALSAPDSLLGQLEFMRGRWGIIAGAVSLSRARRPRFHPRRRESHLYRPRPDDAAGLRRRRRSARPWPCLARRAAATT